MSLLCGYHQRCFFDEFSPLGDKKKRVDESKKGNFEISFEKMAIS
jgi:hypothetical protein